MQTAYVARITGSFRNSSLVIRLSSFVISSAINLRQGTTDKGLSLKLAK